MIKKMGEWDREMMRIRQRNDENEIEKMRIGQRNDENKVTNDTKIS